MEADEQSSKSTPAVDPTRDDRRRPYSRAGHRARNHESAHADYTEATGAAVAQHPLVPQGAATLVDTDAGLAALITRLRAEGSFAYDSEFIGELTYFPKLCLIQVASSREVALIDPLADLSLRPFWELLCDPSVEKTVHAGQQDIEPVIRHMGIAPANIFDTQVAAGFIAMPYPVSLSKLVLELTGARLGKGLTFTHWDQRPLSAVQLRYAADDVRYLPLARSELGRRLDANGHASWAAEECAALCDTSLYRFDPQMQYQRVRGATGLPPRGLAVLRELTVWRDTAARAHDLPPRSFLKDEILIDLARNPVRAVEKLSRVRGLPRPVEHAHGQKIVDSTLKALSLSAEEHPAPRETEQTPVEKFRTDALWAAAQSLCAGRSVDPALVTNRQEVAEFYRLIEGGKPILDHHLMVGWRGEALGKDLVRFLAGQLSIGLGWSNLAMQARVDG